MPAKRVGTKPFLPLDGRLLVPEGGQKSEREFLVVKTLGGQLGNGFFNFDGVHQPCRATRPLEGALTPNSPSRVARADGRQGAIHPTRARILASTFASPGAPSGEIAPMTAPWRRGSILPYEVRVVAMFS